MFSNSQVLAAAVGVFVVGFSSIATGVNFIATVHMLRAPGMTWFRLPLFVWAIYATSLVLVLATPVLADHVAAGIAERWFGFPIFDPAHGGDPLLFQHLFWFYSHPAVYIMVLPAMGVVIGGHHLLRARNASSATTFMVYAMMAIAGIGFFVWGHHMFVSRAVGLRESGLFVPVLRHRRALGDQGVQLDGDPLSRPDHASKPRCSMRWASSACSRSAA